MLFTVFAHAEIDDPGAIAGEAGDKIDAFEKRDGIAEPASVDFIPRRVVNNDKIGFGCDANRTIFASAAGGDTEDVRAVGTNPGVGVGWVVAQSRVWIGLCESGIDRVLIVNDAVSKRLWRICELAPALIPDGQNP